MIQHFLSNTWQLTQTGLLLADDVGVGKTAQIMAFIAFFVDQFLNSIKGKRKLPPILGALPLLLPQTLWAYFYCFTDRLNFGFGDSTTIENLPHLVIVPGTTLEQWQNEFKVFFQPQSLKIICHPTSWKSMEKFWGPQGPLAQSRCHLAKVIVLMPHSVRASTENRHQYVF